MTSRRLAQAARRNADQQSALLAFAPSVLLHATVTTVTPGAARGGTAAVSVTWRGQQILVNGYNAGYTPGVGDRVLCGVVDNQLDIICPLAGQPIV